MSIHNLENELASFLGGKRIIFGATVPAAATAGYPFGAIFIHTDGASGDDAVYINTGSSTSCSFTSLASVAASDYGATGMKADVVAESTAAAGVTVDGVLLKDNQATADAFLFSAAGVATLAAAGSVQGDAAAIAAQVTFVTASDGAKGVALPTAVEGDMRIVYNTVAAALKVYPNSSDDINDGSANAAIVLPAKQAGIFIAVDGTTWAYFGGLGVSQGAALTAADASTVDGTYGAEEATVIGNMRTRLGEIEARLEATGIIAAN